MGPLEEGAALLRKKTWLASNKLLAVGRNYKNIERKRDDGGGKRPTKGLFHALQEKHKGS